MNNINKIQYSITSFDEYLQQGYVSVIEKLQANEINLNEEEVKLLDFVSNNYKTVKTVLDNYTPNESLTALTKTMAPLDVYIIMENWCGSSAGNVPYIVKILQTIPNTTIHIVPRDSNEEFMNAYLSDGKKSIPIVIGFEKKGNELFKWGSSTSAQNEYAKELQTQQIAFPEFIIAMRIWFLANNADAVEADFMKIFSSLNLV
jgi:Thioredoxin